jgi:large subunit ribosomal protein L22
MKRIRPAPMGRAFRYQRRMAHLEIALAERNGKDAGVATTVTEAEPAPAPKKARPAAARPKAQAKRKVAGKKPAAKKKAGSKK